MKQEAIEVPESFYSLKNVSGPAVSVDELTYSARDWDVATEEQKTLTAGQVPEYFDY